MTFIRWKKQVMQSLLLPKAGQGESDLLINHANLTALQLDGRFATHIHVLQQQFDVQAHQLQATPQASDATLHPNAHAIASNGRRWLKAPLTDTKRCDILAQRVALDPMPKANMPLTLMCRLAASNITQEKYNQLYQESKQAGQCSDSLKPTTTPDWALPIEQALSIVSKALNTHDKQRLNELVDQGRLRLVAFNCIDNDLYNDLCNELGNVCVMSSAGALIQLEHKLRVVDVIALSHEVGHALHMEHRWHQGLYWPADVVTSEAQAIAMELHVLNKTPHPKRALLKQTQITFYGPWHVALHQFELGLYALPAIAPDQLDQLWHQCTKAFDAPAGGWRHVQHLYTSPFYLVCYPLALGCTMGGHNGGAVNWI
jgi:hypothetical protein